MKRTNILLLLMLLTFFSCSQITFLGADKGGCNELKETEINPKKSRTEKPDTVFYSVENKVLTLYTGINHICCTPFDTKASIEGNSIIMEITDTCPAPDYNCYCRCNCYYTFNFNFTDFGVKEYTYELYLKEARAEKRKLIFNGDIDIK